MAHLGIGAYLNVHEGPFGVGGGAVTPDRSYSLTTHSVYSPLTSSPSSPPPPPPPPPPTPTPTHTPTPTTTTMPTGLV